MFATVLTVIALIAAGGGSSRPNAPELVQVYLDQVHPGIQRSAQDGADFADIRTNAAKLGRDGVDRRLDRLARSVDTTLSDVEALSPPASLRVAHAYLVAVLGVRSKGVHEARGAFDAALTLTPAADQGAADAVDQLLAVGQDLTLGDRAFGLFTGALPAKIARPPAAVWVATPSDWSSGELQTFVVLLRSTASLTAVHDLAMVAFQTDPPAVSTTADGIEVIPASKAMSISMVVQNVGNQPEHQVTVTALLTLSNGSQQSLRDFIDLAPGQRRAITLQSLHPATGTSGTLQVIVQPVPGQTDLKHNSIVTPVEFR
ncbi:MAG: hypothetical protein NVS1B12_07040 [Acidimicrobiales bacterium]